MCLICIDFLKGAMTIREAKSALTEFIISGDQAYAGHAEDVFKLISEKEKLESTEGAD
jgi:hypothetical protein